MDTYNSNGNVLFDEYGRVIYPPPQAVPANSFEETANPYNATFAEYGVPATALPQAGYPEAGYPELPRFGAPAGYPDVYDQPNRVAPAPGFDVYGQPVPTPYEDYASYLSAGADPYAPQEPAPFPNSFEAQYYGFAGPAQSGNGGFAAPYENYGVPNAYAAPRIDASYPPAQQVYDPYVPAIPPQYYGQPYAPPQGQPQAGPPMPERPQLNQPVQAPAQSAQPLPEAVRLQPVPNGGQQHPAHTVNLYPDFPDQAPGQAPVQVPSPQQAQPAHPSNPFDMQAAGFFEPQPASQPKSESRPAQNPAFRADQFEPFPAPAQGGEAPRAESFFDASIFENDPASTAPHPAAEAAASPFAPQPAPQEQREASAANPFSSADLFAGPTFSFESPAPTRPEVQDPATAPAQQSFTGNPFEDFFAAAASNVPAQSEPVAPFFEVPRSGAQSTGPQPFGETPFAAQPQDAGPQPFGENPFAAQPQDAEPQPFGENPFAAQPQDAGPQPFGENPFAAQPQDAGPQPFEANPFAAQPQDAGPQPFGENPFAAQPQDAGPQPFEENPFAAQPQDAEPQPFGENPFAAQPQDAGPQPSGDVSAAAQSQAAESAPLAFDFGGDPAVFGFGEMARRAAQDPQKFETLAIEPQPEIASPQAAQEKPLQPAGPPVADAAADSAEQEPYKPDFSGNIFESTVTLEEPRAPMRDTEIFRIAEELSQAVLVKSYSRAFNDNNLMKEGKRLLLDVEGITSEYFVSEAGGTPFSLYQNISMQFNSGSCTALISDIPLASYALARSICESADLGLDDEPVSVADTAAGDEGQILYIGSDTMLPMEMSAFEFLLYTQNTGKGSGDSGAKLDVLLSQLGLAAYRDSLLYELPYSHRILFLILAATLNPSVVSVVVNDPKFVIDAEDDMLARRIFALLVNRGKCAILSCCNAYLMSAVCNRVAVIRRGELAFFGEYKKFLDSYCLGIMSFNTDNAPSFSIQLEKKHPEITVLCKEKLVYLVRKKGQPEVNLETLIKDVISLGADYNSIVMDEKSFPIACKEVLDRA